MHTHTNIYKEIKKDTHYTFKVMNFFFDSQDVFRNSFRNLHFKNNNIVQIKIVLNCKGLVEIYIMIHLW